jgi:hypothetical protein
MGNAPYVRHRVREFTEKSPMGKGELIATFEQTVQRAVEVIERLGEADLTRRSVIQGREVSGAEDLIGVSRAAITGRIAFAVKYEERRRPGFAGWTSINENCQNSANGFEFRTIRNC